MTDDLMAARRIKALAIAIRKANRIEVGVWGTVLMAQTTKAAARELNGATDGLIPWRYVDGVLYLAEPGRQTPETSSA